MSEETVLYRKETSKNGRVRYRPARKLADLYSGDIWPFGFHLVQVDKNVTSRRYDIDPDYAALVAALMIAEEQITGLLVDQLEWKLDKPLTVEQQQAWDSVKELIFGDERARVTRPAIRTAVRESLDNIQPIIDEILTNPALKKAYETFHLVCELTKNERAQL